MAEPRPIEHAALSGTSRVFPFGKPTSAMGQLPGNMMTVVSQLLTGAPDSTPPVGAGGSPPVTATPALNGAEASATTPPAGNGDGAVMQCADGGVEGMIADLTDQSSTTEHATASAPCQVGKTQGPFILM